MPFKLRVGIDDRVARLIRPLLSRKALLAILLISPVAVFAAITKPYTFTDGQAVSASQVNANFDAVVSGMNALSLSCTTRQAPSASSSRTYGFGSKATCATGEMLTGGACVVATASAATASIINGSTYECILGGSGSDSVTAQAICCKLNKP